MERKILSVTLQDRIRNQDLRKITNIKDAATSATVTKWKWAGHAMRMDHNRWAHKTTTWNWRQRRRTTEKMGGRFNTQFRTQMDDKSQGQNERRQMTEAAAQHT
ncbi:hypothetical protein C0J52_10348 [Blattella germanica]|nr:hypothetical protein C0J52_10348 [Blattella germanica]